MTNSTEVIIYTDGGCRGNPGIGGWGAALSAKGQTKELYGAEADTTNNRMEMMAAIRALSALKKPCTVTLYTDSVYLRDGINKWIAGWKAKGWKTANRKPVKNQDLWQQIDQLNQLHDVDWQWVKGHSGNPGNELADQLANRAMDEFKA